MENTPRTDPPSRSSSESPSVKHLRYRVAVRRNKPARRLLRVVVGICVALYIQTSQVSGARAAGFAITPQGAAATGKSAAFTAQADDPSAIYYNPAGISQLSAPEFLLGTTVIIPRTTYTPSPNQGGRKAREENQTFFLPQMYAVIPIGRDVTAGIGLFTPFGLATDWPIDWDGRFQVTYIAVRATELNPTLSWRPAPWLSIAGGLDIAHVTLRQRRQINLSRVGENAGLVPLSGNPEGSVELSGDATSVGSNVGLLITPSDRWQIGASLRSRLHAEENNGHADFTIPVPALQPFFPDGKVRTEIDLPPVLRTGVLVRPLPQWNVELDVIWTGWSTIDRLVVEFAPGLAMPRGTTDFSWENSLTYNLGTEYRWPSFALRGGYTFDYSPIPDDTISPLLPDGTRHWFSLGIGYNPPRWNIDLAYTLILIRRLKENNFGEQYSSSGAPPAILPIDARANGGYRNFTHVV